MSWTAETSFLHQAARNAFIVAGVLVFAVGAGDMLAGGSKVQEYRAVVAEAIPPVPYDPAALFPKASEAQERRAVAEAKLAFYQLLFVAGQLLAAVGVLLMGIGLLRQRQRVVRTTPVRAALH